MALLTPPHSSHRSEKSKENRLPPLPLAGPSTRSVVWAAENTIHSLATPLKTASISSKQRPSISKSILKSVPHTPQPEVSSAAFTRETTPEPSDPLVDLHYLDHPVQQILSNGSDEEESLKELIVGYNVLAARLRTCVTESTDADASWPIFQPLRKKTQAFVDAIVRDVKRALVNPLSHHSTKLDENPVKLPQHALPSPASSPVKKKGGLSEEQVKYARDLSTTCHSVIKLLTVILSLPAIYRVFEETQLADILTAVLAIPLTDDLPTANSRKTCALAIGLLQSQRLPAEVLRPAASRIAYALRRGMDGELGKEGKKGSANDGLKAIHDLCVYLPDIFVPAFTPLLPSLLANLLAPTLALRTQACHALGGFVLGLVDIPVSTVNTKISSTVAAFITTPSPSPGKSAKGAKQPTEAAIVRTLRVTMDNAHPPHVASGPLWAMSVIASFIVLIGPRLYAETKLNRILSTLLSHGLRNTRSALRALTCAAWRTITWAYFQPPLPVDDGEESEVDEESYMRSKQARLAHCKVMLSVVECQAGASTMAALLADESMTGEEPLRLAIDILLSMTSKAGHTCQEGVDVLQQMTSGIQLAEPFNLRSLIPTGLFSAYPGLLTADFKCLAAPVKDVYDGLPGVEQIRSLTREELARDWVFRGIMMAWRTSLGCLEMEDQAEVPETLSKIWENLLKANLSLLEEKGDEDAITSFAACATKYITYVLEDSKLNLMPRSSYEKQSIVAIATAAALAEPTPGSDDTILEYSGNNVCTNGELRMRVIQHMWSIMVKVFPPGMLRECGETFLTSLMKNEDALVRGTGTAVVIVDDDAIDQTRSAWVALCTDVVLACGDADVVRVFWNCQEDMAAARAAGHRTTNWNRDYTSGVWKTFVERWRESDGAWEGSIVLLGVPFTDNHTWGLTSDDYSLWEELKDYTIFKALDLGIEAPIVLDKVAAFVSSFQTPGASPASSLRLVDFLLSNLEAPDMRELPMNILELTSETMHALYPLGSRFKQFGMWMIRSLAVVIEHCPAELALQMLQTLQDGLCLWLSDKRGVWTDNELTYDIIPLYQHIVLKVQVLPECLDTLTATATLLDSVFRHRTPVPAVESITDFWNLVYARMTPPAAGWPSPLCHCLTAVGILPAEENLTQETSISPTPDPRSALASAFVIQPISPRTPISSSFSTPPTAIIRREALSRVQSPQRPQKLFGAFPIIPSTPPSPISHRRSSGSSSVRRTPLSAIQLCDTPLKRRRLMDVDNDNKENHLHSEKITSVADRITSLGLPNPLKHRLEDDEDEDVQEVGKPPLKKLKARMKPRSKPAAKRPRLPSPTPSTASYNSNESEDERWVEAELTAVVPFLSKHVVKDEDESNSETVSPTRRRTRGNGLRALKTTSGAVPRKRSSTEREGFRILDGANKNIRRIDLSKMTLRRSTSIPETLLNSVNGRKRKLRGSDATEGASNANNLPSGIKFGPPRHAKRSFSLPSSDSAPLVTQPMSSDDDPHYGQVTPHHLISPAPSRRPGSLRGRLSTSTRQYGRSGMKSLLEDELPSSDDSISSSSTAGWDSESPTKDLATRQLQRSSSSDALSKVHSLTA